MPRTMTRLNIFENPDASVGLSSTKKETKETKVEHRSLAVITIPSRIGDSRKIADQIINAETAPQDRTIRQAGMQNKLTRARLNGEPYNEREIKTLIAEKTNGRFGSSSLNASQEVDKIFKGVVAAETAIRRAQSDFRKLNPPNQVQEIYLDDTLDAHHAVDFIDVRFKTDDEGNILGVEEIRLVQVKKSETGLVTQSEILKAHRAYVDRLLERKEVFKSQERELVKHIRSGKFFEKETYKDMTGEQVAGQLFEVCFSFVDSLLQGEDIELTQEKIDILVETNTVSKEDLFIFAGIMTDQHQQTTYRHYIKEIFGFNNEQEERIQKRLNEVLDKINISPQSINDLLPKEKRLPKVFGVSDITSVIYHGGIIDEIPLRTNVDIAATAEVV